MTKEVTDDTGRFGDLEPDDHPDCYQATSPWLARWGPSPRELRLAGALDSAFGRPVRLLEIGAGFGGFAVAAAQLGHSVVAIERSPARADIARRQARQPERFGSGSIEVCEGDVFGVELGGPYEAVVCWNSFGCWPVGCDVRFLRRIEDWIGDDGYGLIDVFDPAWWSGLDRWKTARAGVREHIRCRPGSGLIEIDYQLPGRVDDAVNEIVRCASRDEAERLAGEAGLSARAGPTDIRRGTYLLTVTRAP